MEPIKTLPIDGDQSFRSYTHHAVRIDGLSAGQAGNLRGNPHNLTGKRRVLGGASEYGVYGWSRGVRRVCRMLERTESVGLGGP